MPTFTRNHCSVKLSRARTLQFRDRKSHDLFLHFTALKIARFEMLRESAGFFSISRIKQLNHGSGSINATSSIDAWADAKPKIVGCHPSSIAATRHF